MRGTSRHGRGPCGTQANEVDVHRNLVTDRLLEGQLLDGESIAVTVTGIRGSVREGNLPATSGGGQGWRAGMGIAS